MNLHFILVKMRFNTGIQQQDIQEQDLDNMDKALRVEATQLVAEVEEARCRETVAALANVACRNQ